MDQTLVTKYSNQCGCNIFILYRENTPVQTLYKFCKHCKTIKDRKNLKIKIAFQSKHVSSQIYHAHLDEIFDFLLKDEYN